MLKYKIKCRACGYFLHEDTHNEVYISSFDKMKNDIYFVAKEHILAAHYDENEDFDFFKMFEIIEEIEEIEEKSILRPEEEAFLRPLMKKALGMAPEEENEDFDEHWARFKELLRQQETK